MLGRRIPLKACIGVLHARFLEPTTVTYHTLHVHELTENIINIFPSSGDVGNFIVRLSGGVGGGADEVRYSMAVRTHDRVQRFLITRYITGYYVFGGRPYNS